jgi:hypothetical protein
MYLVFFLHSIQAVFDFILMTCFSVVPLYNLYGRHSKCAMASCLFHTDAQKLQAVC